MSTRRPLHTTLLLFALLFLPARALAQSVWLPADPANGAQVALEVHKSFFDQAVNVSLLSSAYVLSGHVPLSGRLALAAELPVAYLATTPDYGEATSDATLGNPYLGVVYSAASAAVLEGGVRLPVLTEFDDGALSGLVADFDRMEAYVPETLMATAMVSNVRRTEGTSLRFRTGFTALVPFERRNVDVPGGRSGGDEVDIMLNYGLTGTFTPGDLRVSGGVTGRLILASGGSVSDRIIQQMTMMVGRRYGRFTPSFVVRAPLDEQLNNLVSGVVGLQLAVSLD